MKYTTGWTRKLVRTPEKYQQWLDSLQDGDEVLLQKFQEPKLNSAFNFPFESWRIEKGTIRRNQVDLKHKTVPINRKHGWGIYWNSPDPFLSVFPHRIIPNHSDLLRDDEELALIHMPVYEPLYLNQYRYVFLAKTDTERHTIKNKYPLNYTLDSDQGYLVYCFAGYEDGFNSELNSMFLYSQFVEG